MAYATIDDVFNRYKPIGSMVGAGSSLSTDKRNHEVGDGGDGSRRLAIA